MAVAIGRAPTAAEGALWQRAADTAGRAYAPYSSFKVGAAVLGASGAVHLGVNVESASSPAGVCAERVALGAAVTAGESGVTAVAVAVAGDQDALPCGVCLQALAEFGDPVVVARVDGSVRALALSELLTTPFTR